jgi:pimeloyl-ACP methyl ester carboxylesterase
MRTTKNCVRTELEFKTSGPTRSCQALLKRRVPSILAKLGACFFALSALATPAFAQPKSGGVVKNIVFVHGAWADGSSWSKVIPLLQAKGFNVVAVQNPVTSLADDVLFTRRALAAIDGPILLVGHSWGGQVITEAGNDPKVVGLVYVCAPASTRGKRSARC